mgnify:CR=1 FL=1
MKEPLENMGPYQLISLLGQGGMGSVFHARHQESGQEVALKTVPLSEEKLFNSLRREIHILSRLRHPGIVSIVAQGIEKGQPWYAMELIQGKTLRQYVEDEQENEKVQHDPFSTAEVTIHQTSPIHEHWTRTLVDLHPTFIQQIEEQENEWTSAPTQPAFFAISPQDESAQKKRKRYLSIIRQLCVPLAYLHGEGVVHCDLKPDNILICENGQIKLIDFGLLTQFAGALNREVSDIGMVGQGTLLYMAPEQIQGKLVDARADLYALGCILYELLTGQTPFHGSQFEIIGQHLYREPLPPSTINPDLPPQLDAILLELLAKQPHQRLGYADTLGNALEAFGADSAELSSLPTPQVYLYRPSLAGREETLEELNTRLADLKQKKGSMTFLTGVSGVGKTRLTIELTQMAHQKSVQVIGGGGSEKVSSPLGIFLPALELLTDRVRNMSPQESRDYLPEQIRVLAQYSPELRGLPSLAKFPAPTHLPPKQSRIRVFRTLSTVLKKLTAKHPLLMILDDLHAANELSLAALEYIVEHNQETELMLFGVARTEESGEELRTLMAKEHINHIELERLDEEAVGSIIQDMLALTEIPSSLRTHLAQQSEGNPFFIAEYLRAAVEKGFLQRQQNGIWQVTSAEGESKDFADLAQLPLPNSLLSIISQRLTHLSQSARELLSAASVLGREFPMGLLLQVAKLEESHFFEVLQELHRYRVIDEWQAEQLSFEHDKIRKVVYEELQPDARVRWHRQAAEISESYFLDTIEIESANIGRHWELAQEFQKAQTFYLQAAEWYQEQYANKDAILLYQKYLKLQEEPTTASVKVQHALGELFERIGYHQEALDAYQPALEDSRTLEEKELEGESLSFLGRVHWRTGKMDEAVTYYEEALAIHRSIHSRYNQGVVLCYLASVYFYRGQLDKALILYQEALGLHQEVDNRVHMGMTLNNLANIYLEQGKLTQAYDLYEQALELHRENKLRTHEGTAMNNFAHVLHYQGKLKAASQLYQNAHEIFREVGDRSSEGIVQGNRAFICCELGHLEEAQKLYQEAIAIHQETNNRIFEAIHQAFQSQLKRRLDFPKSEVTADLDTAERLFQESGERLYVVIVYCERGHNAINEGKSAQDFLEKGQELAAQSNVTAETPTEIGFALARLSHAQKAFETGAPLFNGESTEHISKACLDALRAQKEQS